MRRILILLTVLTPAAFAVDPPEYQTAIQQVQAGRWSEALKSLAPLLKRYGDNPKLLNLEGLAFAGAGRSAEAREAFQKALRDRPDFWPALKNLTIVEWNSGSPGAAAHTEAALKSAPEDPVLNAYGALSSIARKEIKVTLERFEKSGDSVRVLPVELKYKLAVQLGENALYPQSVSLFQQILRSGVDSQVLRYNLALAQFRAKRYGEAVNTLEPLRSRSPDADVLNLLAQVYQESGEMQKAADTFREAISRDPKDENNYLDLANLCVDAGLLDQAISVIDAGLTRIPRSARLNFEAGLLRVLSRDFSGAQTAFQRAAALQPDNELPAAAIGLAKIQQASLDEAIAGLRKELGTKHRSGMLWYLLGTALMHGGTAHGSPQEQEAATAYKHAIDVDPKLPWPYVELAKIYLSQQRTPEATRLLERAIQLDPDSRPAYYQLALAYRTLHEPLRSEQMFGKVRELNAREHGSTQQSQRLTQH